MTSMTRSIHACFALVLVMGACSRTAANYEGQPSDQELVELRVGACEAMCETMDRCDPTRFANVEPSDCYTRCMTLMPALYEVNQCGSREMLSMYCIGDQTCEEYEEWDLSIDRQDYEGTACVAEYELALHCDEDLPFDMHEYGSFEP